jgi:hypothetical protein
VSIDEATREARVGDRIRPVGGHPEDVLVVTWVGVDQIACGRLYLWRRDYTLLPVSARAVLAVIAKKGGA